MVDTPIGTNSPNYTLVSGDLGATIYCRVTATNASGSSNAISNVVGPVTAAPAEGSPAMTNMWTWLKADAGTYTDTGLTTPATTDGATVNGWDDQSPGDRNFFESAGPNAGPALELGELNSKPVLRFTAGFLDGPSPAALTQGEVFIVVKAASGAPSGIENSLWCFGTSGESVLYPYTSGDIYDDWGSTTRQNSGNPTVDLGTWHLYNVVSTSAEWTSFINNVLHYTTATNTVAFTTLPGVGRDTTTQCFPGDIAEVVMYSAKCSAPDKLQTVTYLSDKYALGIV